MLIVLEQQKSTRIHPKNGSAFQPCMSMASEISISSMVESSTPRILIPQRQNFTKSIITMLCHGSRPKSNNLPNRSGTCTPEQTTQLFNQILDHEIEPIGSFTWPISTRAQRGLDLKFMNQSTYCLSSTRLNPHPEPAAYIKQTQIVLKAY